VHLYIHVPFCARRCSYCDFAIAVRRDIPTRAFVDAVRAEWLGWQRHPVWADAGSVRTVYFGGGTPSRLEPSGIAELLDAIHRSRTIDVDAEVTLEANPDDVTATAAEAWRAAGVNRVSLGVQTFDPAALRWMHRTHTAGQVGPAADVLRGARIAQLSLDLIFGLPAALERDWPRDLAQAFALAPDHLSLYGLTVERYAAEFLDADRALAREGYEHYEVSNAARPGRRARHNSAYWSRAPFIGLGPSAHSGFGRTRQWNLREWSAYERASAAGQSLVDGAELLSDEAVALEELYLGLRTADGFPVDRLDAGTRAAWTGAGWAETMDGRLRLTPEGWLRLDALVGSAAI
jgi:oxygen-independent coproporphyrinogen-3 oxidase